MIYEEQLVCHSENGKWTCIYTCQGEKVETTGGSMNDVLQQAYKRMEEKIEKKEAKKIEERKRNH